MISVVKMDHIGPILIFDQLVHITHAYIVGCTVKTWVRSDHAGYDV